ncbi:hypothetical protein QWI17_02050 [Gilvimarinus sp. SDUM040013]|uniref:Uncharacterized protein n=1 Tax=Gilvimarinus gilvus TaxID=3058038 RepID=A0ABU4RZ79_9GAMM|nr:hypothetical protein [Gilvimarinus sp. SDUM040013]MDO3384613.1 hypothetical protein [Gilvimarinus sp. SDUM040013]MDX6850199.1 hypothetical protein [Gilvimarinus sp. SDUM040013]
MKNYESMRAVVFVALLTGFNSFSYGEASTEVYLNENIGFDVEGFKYEQEQYPCEVDKHLVKQIVEQSKAQHLAIEATDTKGDIYDQGIPVLAIDINALVLGADEYNYGAQTHSNLPSVKVTSALIDKNRFKNGYVQANHSCAIASLKEFTPSSDILDMGVNVTVCGAVEKCLKDLSKDVVHWTQSQLK